MKKNLSFIIVMFFMSSLFSQISTVYHVSTTGDDNDSGLLWCYAFRTLEHAIDMAKENGVSLIYVAQGTYQLPSKASYKMQNNLSIYGGYVGTGIDYTRNWTLYKTYLVGNGAPVIKNDFSSTTPLNNTAVLDGFYIQNGKGMSIFDNLGGGGIYNLHASPIIRNCTITSNQLSGVNCENSSGIFENVTFLNNTGLSGAGLNCRYSTLTLTNVIFKGNIATDFGGGIACGSSTLTLNNVIFESNQANYGGGINAGMSDVNISQSRFVMNKASGSNATGGAIGIGAGSSAQIINTYIQGNQAESSGGGISCVGSTSSDGATNCTLINCLITGNLATHNGGGVYSRRASVTLINATIAGNHARTNSGGGLFGARAPSIKLYNTVVYHNNYAERYTSQAGRNIANDQSTCEYYNCRIEGCCESSIGSVFNNTSEGEPCFLLFEYATSTQATTEGDFHPYYNRYYNYRICESSLHRTGNIAYNSTSRDIEGWERSHNGAMNIGAYELTMSPSGGTRNGENNTGIQNSMAEHITIDEITGNERFYMDDTFNMYPNPTSSGSVLFIESGEMYRGARIEIYNILGVRVFDAKVTDYVMEMNCSFMKGQYLLRVISQDGNYIKTEKIIVL